MSAEQPEPGPIPVESASHPIPTWVLGLMAVVVLLGGVYLALDVGRGAAPAPGPSDGSADAMALIEQAGCQNCHGADLAGQGTFPSLHGIAAGPKSDNLQQLGADYPDTWPNLWIDGTGPEVADLDRGGMPQFGDGILTSEEIGIIVDYLLTLE